MALSALRLSHEAHENIYYHFRRPANVQRAVEKLPSEQHQSRVNPASSNRSEVSWTRPRQDGCRAVKEFPLFRLDKVK